MKNLVNKLTEGDVPNELGYKSTEEVPYTLEDEYLKIAKFMEYIYRPVDKANKYLIPGWYQNENSSSWVSKSTRSLDFKYSWKNLMEVVLKIESLKSQRYGGFRVIIHGDTCTIQSLEKRKESAYSKSYASKTKINSVYQSILLFIDWYSDNKF